MSTARNDVAGSWSIGGGAGGGAVSSVNGETGAVVLGAADVGAIPTTAYGAWTTVASLGANVSQTAGQNLQVRNAPGDRIEFRGRITSTGAATGTLFTLPVGQRPQIVKGFDLRTFVTAVELLLTVNLDGTVTTAGAFAVTGQLSFDSVSLDLDA